MIGQNISLNSLISFTRIVEFSCYVKIERNGVEMKMKSNQNSLCKVLLIDYLYKVSQTENKSVNKIQFKNSSDQEFFIIEINYIERIIDKMIEDGKLTILFNKSLNEKFIIFLFKTTKDILDNFVTNINKLKNAGNDKNKPNNIINLIPNNNITLVNKKRKLQDLYAQANSNSNIPNLQLKKFKQNSSSTNLNLNKNKINILDLSEDIFYSLFEYIDNSNLVKVCLINKECKMKYDKIIDKMKLRDDIPSRSFNNLLNRFPNLKHLILGQCKYLKNENFKYFDVELKNLIYLDMKEVQNLNDASIRKLLSKTKSQKISSIKINFYLESLTSALVYISEFFININTLEILSEYLSKDMEDLMKQLEKHPRFLHPNLFNIICEIILTKKHLNHLSLFLFNSVKINSDFLSHSTKGKSLLNNLTHLSLNILIIEKVKDLNFLTTAINLVNFNLNEICLCENLNNTKKLKRCDFSELRTISNELENMNPEEQLDNLNLDFDNDYLEVFISIFSKMKSLKILSLGQFVNGEILKIISLFCKGINKFILFSSQISDDHLKEILNNCLELTHMDLRGCLNIQGNCFLEVENLSQNLKNVKLSLMNFNFYNLIKFLNQKGITAENYINKHY